MLAPRRLCRAGVLALAALELATVPPPATAQYFGRNKVRYEAFRFELLRTKHFEVYFYPEEAAAAPLVARMAERWYARHAATLGHQLRGVQTLIVYASHPHFEQTNAIEGDIGEGTGGVTEALKRRIVMPLAGPLAETDHVLGHELVHAFQYDITGQGRGGLAAIPTAARLPLSAALDEHDTPARLVQRVRPRPLQRHPDRLLGMGRQPQAQREDAQVAAARLRQPAALAEPVFSILIAVPVVEVQRRLDDLVAFIRDAEGLNAAARCVRIQEQLDLIDRELTLCSLQPCH